MFLFLGQDLLSAKIFSFLCILQLLYTIFSCLKSQSMHIYSMMFFYPFMPSSAVLLLLCPALNYELLLCIICIVRYPNVCFGFFMHCSFSALPCSNVFPISVSTCSLQFSRHSHGYFFFYPLCVFEDLHLHI